MFHLIVQIALAVLGCQPENKRGYHFAKIGKLQHLKRVFEVELHDLVIIARRDLAVYQKYQQRFANIL